ncbi:MAG: zinc ribbon domain-containing protein [Methanomicrobiales archaeon]|nr:zinc ribbon domain-containing protein [Methanomicrobiales archaeon]
MRFCGNCGAKNDDGKKFCTKCGRQLGVPAAPAGPAIPARQPAPQTRVQQPAAQQWQPVAPAPPQKRGWGRTLAIVFLIVIGIALAGTVLLLFLPGGSGGTGGGGGTGGSGGGTSGTTAVNDAAMNAQIAAATKISSEQAKKAVGSAADALDAGNTATFSGLMMGDIITIPGVQGTIPPADQKALAAAIRQATVVEAFPDIVFYSMNFNGKEYQFYSMKEGSVWKIGGL